MAHILKLFGLRCYDTNHVFRVDKGFVAQIQSVSRSSVTRPLSPECEAEAGKTTALVGASGAGKSTIFNLLTRMVDPQTGSVQVGDINVADLATDDLRGLFSVVTQEGLLFDETLRENIVLGRTDVSDEALQKALDASHVADFLDKLPDGLDTLVGPRGSALSGGQRQGVAVARAATFGSKVIILDEPTAALGVKESRKVLELIQDVNARGIPIILISHNMPHVFELADRIHVHRLGKRLCVIDPKDYTMSDAVAFMTGAKEPPLQ